MELNGPSQFSSKSISFFLDLFKWGCQSWLWGADTEGQHRGTRDKSEAIRTPCSWTEHMLHGARLCLHFLWLRNCAVGDGRERKEDLKEHSF